MYPISYEADFNPAPNRVTTFFRIVLAIPWMIAALFWGLIFWITQLIAWLVVIVIGRYPQGLYDLNAGIVRFGVRYTAWAYLQTDAWPSLGIGDDPTYPIRINFAPPAPRQSRLKALFRIVLVLPMLLLSYAVNYLHLWLAAIAWLTIVFRGYLPEGIHVAMTFCNGFYARLYGYHAILTDEYPPIGIEAARGGAAPPPSPPVMPPPPPAAPAV